MGLARGTAKPPQGAVRLTEKPGLEAALVTDRTGARAPALHLVLLAVIVAACTIAGCSSRTAPARAPGSPPPITTGGRAAGTPLASPTSAPSTAVTSPPPSASAPAPALFSDETACTASSPGATPTPDSAPVVVRWHLPPGNACVVTTGAADLANQLQRDLAAAPPAPTASRNCAADQGGRADLRIGGKPAAAIELGACWEMELADGSTRMVTDAVKSDLRPIAPMAVRAWLE